MFKDLPGLRNDAIVKMHVNTIHLTSGSRLNCSTLQEYHLLGFFDTHLHTTGKMWFPAKENIVRILVFYKPLSDVTQ